MPGRRENFNFSNECGWIANGNVGLHWREDGDRDSETILFLNSLGTDLRLWDHVLPSFSGYHCVRLDLRGHGLSDAPNGEYSLEDLTADVVALIEHLQLDQFVIIGVSLGGMIAQSLASIMPKRVKRLVLSNTAARMGDPDMWRMRIKAVEDAGTVAAISDAVLDRWFAVPFLQSREVEKWRNMLSRTPHKGYIGCCAALADADLTSVSPSISCPTLVVAGSEDTASPPDIVNTLATLLPNSRFIQIEGAGHLPMVETPEKFSNAVNNFMGEAQ